MNKYGPNKTEVVYNDHGRSKDHKGYAYVHFDDHRDARDTIAYCGNIFFALSKTNSLQTISHF
jgi:hypothetical protein